MRFAWTVGLVGVRLVVEKIWRVRVVVRLFGFGLAFLWEDA